ncbi:MAG: hypothetical protein ABH817_02245 [archaeon]
MTKKYILVSMEDEKSNKLAGVLGSKSCKKMVNFLSETKEASQKDISVALKMPLNTLEYNLKKLIGSGLIERSKNFFWSKKGKKILMYKISNKSILISPRSTQKVNSKLTSILIMFGFTALATFLVKIISESNNFIVNYAKSEVLTAPGIGEDLIATPIPTLVWPWFLAGALFIVTLFLIINWRKL